MADELGVSNHLTARAGVYQYVRRVPDDVRAAFPFGRIQKSLGTRDQRQARATALDLDRQWDQRFNEARQRSGVAVEGFGPSVVSTADWTWPDWEGCLVPESRDATLSREAEEALWQGFFTAAPERRREFEPSSKGRKRRRAPSPDSTG